MHAGLTLGGPVYWLLFVVLFGTGGLSLFTFGDSVRRRDTDFAAVREHRLVYVLPQALYAVAFVLYQIPLTSGVFPWLGTAVIGATPFALAEQVAYLLRVVFPTQARREVRLAAEEARTRPSDRATPEE